MDFDPLSFFTPSLSVEVENLLNSTEEAQQQDELAEISKHTKNDDSMNNEHGNEHDNEHDNKHDDIGDLDDLQPLHILDLPLLQLKPPFEVLSVVLRLLSPDEVLNFTQKEYLTHEIDEESIFNEKDIQHTDLRSALPWFQVYCPRLDSTLKLASVTRLAPSLRANFTSEYNAYLTRIISTELTWITLQTRRDEIHRLASLRISENCGRMAQPEITRKIMLPGLDKYLPGDGNNNKFVFLKEPSMTNDNLGLKTWGSSLVLSSRLLQYANDGERKYLNGRVLELGSGTGLVGIISCILGFDTTLTDLPQIVPNLKNNIKANGLGLLDDDDDDDDDDGSNGVGVYGPNSSCFAKCEALDWSQPELSPVYNMAKFDTIILSDPIYSSQHPHWVVNMIDMFLTDVGEDRLNPPSVLIEIPLRPKFELERHTLWNLMDKHYVEIECEIEDGFDDFGEMKFCFKKFERRRYGKQ